MWGGHFAGDVCECFPDSASIASIRLLLTLLIDCQSFSIAVPSISLEWADVVHIFVMAKVLGAWPA